MSTRIGEALRDLGDAVDAIEADGWTVVGFDPATGDVTSGGTAGLELRIERPFAAGAARSGVDLSVEGCSVDADGSLVLDIAASRPIEAAPAPTTAPSGRSRGSTGPSATPEPSDADDTVDASDEPTVASSDAPDEDESVPAYRDPERLRAVYEAHDSFPAMTEALDVDVTPQTVRRHMIEHGIHEPRAGAEARDGDDDEATARGDEASEAVGETESGGEVEGSGVAVVASGVADDEAAVGEGDEVPGGAASGPRRAGGETGGTDASPGDTGDYAGAADDAPDAAGGADDATDDEEDERRSDSRADGGRSGEDGVAAELAGVDGVTDEQLKEAVRESRTIHELGQRLGVPRERAFRLLNALDLIDLVSGRLETEGRSIPPEELDQRIARATAAGE